jgi:SAM-dependent methyltransferase
MPDYARIYAHQEYLTPGAAETVEIIAEAVRPNESMHILDLASGKGEAAASLAGRFGCRVVCVEPYDPFVHYSAAKFWHFNLRDLVTVVRADGKRLPVRDAVLDAAYCIGAPSIVGLEESLGEMARVVRPGGVVIASDITWRSKPGPLLAEWAWVAEVRQVTTEEYTSGVAAAGLRVDTVQRHGLSAWEEYWTPMIAVAHAAKTGQPADLFLADEIERDVELERRAVDAWLDYVTFVAHKP